MHVLLLRVSVCVWALAGLALAPPLLLALADGDARAAHAFAWPFAAGVAAAAVSVAAIRRQWRNAGAAPAPAPGDAVAAVGAAWVAVSLFGAIPLWLSGAFASAADAFFESASGFTTTGATVLSDVESLPRAVNLWRCETHWLGGMGVIALAVALVPLLGVGGFRLLNAESTGPEKGRLTARIADTAKALWLLYVALTALQATLLRLCGMGWFDAFCHAFSTLGTGGFSTRNASLAAFGSPSAEWVCTAFMFCAALPFALYYRLLSHRGGEVRRATEPKVLLVLAASATALVAAALARGGEPAGRALRLAAFQVSSVLSTTGFASADYALWPSCAQTVLFALLLAGGCSGSTAGGVKLVRWTVLARQAAAEARRLLHPRAVCAIRIDGRPVHEGLVAGVAGFLAAYFALAGATALAGAAAGLPPLEAVTAALSMVGNVGPALGSLGPSANYGALPAALKGWYCFAMLAGRLEIYTMLVLFARLVVVGRRR